MIEKDRCPSCGAEIPAHAPAEQCPKCLLEMGFASEEQRQGDADATSAGSASPRFEPPAIDDLASSFPQLEILEILGQGGMGAVYKARQMNLDRLVAVKILPPSAGADPAFAERFVREAHALAKLTHPNIVAVHDSGKSDEFCYLIMEYVDGVDLRQAMRGGQIQPEEALAIVPQICDALEYAHDQGIVHRDIKPENILVTRQRNVKVADFGLAKLLDRAAPDRSLTGTHQVMGTVHYMAPEQMEGSHLVDHRADIYSLGVVFYEMLTGQLPLGRFEPPSKKVHVDVRLDEVVLRSLEAEPRRRYQSAGDVKSDVDAIVESPQAFVPAEQEIDTEKSHRDRAVGPLPRYSRKAVLGAAWTLVFPVVAFLGIVSTLSRPTAIPRRPLNHKMSYEGGIDEVKDIEWLDRRRSGSPSPRELPSIDAADRDFIESSSAAYPHFEHSGLDPRWRKLLLLVLLLPGATAPFGTTVLGVLAVRDIRHARGLLLGLPLAVADALVFPLLFLDLVILVPIGILTGLLLRHATSFLGGSGINWFFNLAIPVLLAVSVCVFVDFLLVRRVWRHAKSTPA